MKKLTLALAFIAITACQTKKSNNELVRHTQTYLDYISGLSHVPAEDFHTTRHPFHTACRKTLNDKVVATSAESFVSQLRDVRMANKG